MIEANCPKCSSRRKFNILQNNRYTCTTCNSTFSKCKHADCVQMTKKFRVFCDKCVGNAMRNGGSTALSIAGILGVAIFKVIKSRKKL